MLRNYLTVAVRNLMRNKLYSAINVLGLSLGTACCLLILVFVHHETSFDALHGKGDRIYRVLDRVRLMVTVSTQALRVATANPAETLRDQ